MAERQAEGQAEGQATDKGLNPEHGTDRYAEPAASMPDANSNQHCYAEVQRVEVPFVPSAFVLTNVLSRYESNPHM